MRGKRNMVLVVIFILIFNYLHCLVFVMSDIMQDGESIHDLCYLGITHILRNNF